MIITLHGRGSNAETSTTVNKIKEYFEDIEDVYTPSYNTDGIHDEISNELLSYVRTLVDENPHEELIFIGCSMGGYWARYLANRFVYAKLIMINPSLELYGNAYLEDFNDIPITVFLGTDDDVVDYSVALDIYEGRADVNVIEGGDHRLHAYFHKILPVIEKAINTYTD